METTNYLSHFARNVATLRRSKGMSQKEMAKLMEVSVDTVRKLENGIPTPGMNCLAPLYLSQKFGISLDDLWKTDLEG